MERVERVVQISIHTPHAGSDSEVKESSFINSISIHTPHAGSDDLRRRCYEYYIISIHTPHAGSDQADAEVAISYNDFNPHSPCGE